MRRAKRTLNSVHIDALPVINNYIEDCNLFRIFEQFVPAAGNIKISPSCTLLLILRNIMLSSFPLYKLPDWTRNYIPELLELSNTSSDFINDDRFGRSLDQLFLADRATLCTQIALEVIKRYKLQLKSCHDDSTRVNFYGKYIRKVKFSKEAVNITKGYNKDRLNIKQLIFNLVVTSDGAVPIHFKLYDGNVTDASTHQETWEKLHSLIGRPDFIYVADSKLCTKENMSSIDKKEGKFITLMPQTRKEHQVFTKWVERHPLRGQSLWYRNCFPKKENNKDHYRGYEAPRFVSKEGYRIIWIKSSQKQKLDAQKRNQDIKEVEEQFQELNSRINTYYLKTKKAIQEKVENLLKEHNAEDYFNYKIENFRKNLKKHLSRGRPGVNSRYSYSSKIYHKFSWGLKKEVVKKKSHADGFFPLITNIKDLKMAAILKCYKYQPHLEKRHSYLKSVLEVAPVYLKTPERIEALLFLYYLALMIYALIERNLLKAMKKASIKSLPIYPEQRECKRPSAERILEVFKNISKHNLFENGKLVDTFCDPLNVLQLNILELLKIPQKYYSKN